MSRSAGIFARQPRVYATCVLIGEIVGEGRAP